MIVDGLLMLITGIVEFAYGLLPDWNINEHFSLMTAQGLEGWTPATGYIHETTTQLGMLDWVFSIMWQMNKFVPVDHFIAAVSMVLTFWLAMLAYRIAKWLIGVVRGSGTQ